MVVGKAHLAAGLRQEAFPIPLLLLLNNDRGAFFGMKSALKIYRRGVQYDVGTASDCYLSTARDEVMANH